MNEQQWNEFLDKLDFVHLSGRWNLLPLHWLDAETPDSASELSRDLVAALIDIRESLQGSEKDERVAALCEEYRVRLASQSIALDSRLSPPGSRVTLSFLDPKNMGQGDCLITVASWDRVGYLIAETANPGGEHLESVGENPVRKEPGQLNYQHLLFFPDKGTPSPRAFRSLCEKTLRQARGLGARTISVTHLHLPQTGLADRFAAAELVSALRQMLRESPGTNVTIRVFSHRIFEDYRHWFESLKSLGKATDAAEPPARQEFQQEEKEGSSEVADTLRSFAKRSSDLASEATASVTRWFSQAKAPEVQRTDWSGLTYAQYRSLNQLYLKRHDLVEEEDLREGPDETAKHYLHCLFRTVQLESGTTAEEQEREEIESVIEETLRLLPPYHPLARYFQLLKLRLSAELDQVILEELLRQAETWQDMPLLDYLRARGEDTELESVKRLLPPVYPAGSKTSVGL